MIILLRRNVSEPVRGRQTNNTAEIQAAERAISQAKSQGAEIVFLSCRCNILVALLVGSCYQWESYMNNVCNLDSRYRQTQREY